jgi:hypothetical protein
MPYASIWVSFVFRDINNEKMYPFTRITNGLVESTWKIYKNSYGVVDLAPANYVSQILEPTLGTTIKFLERLHNPIEEEEDDNDKIYNPNDQVDFWCKKRKGKVLMKRKKELVGYYQKDRQLSPSAITQQTKKLKHDLLPKTSASCSIDTKHGTSAPQSPSSPTAYDELVANGNLL